jgi:ribosomal protein S18 acetylase RimI-like enzyme
MSFTVRRLTPDDVAAFREIRLEGLVAEPFSFGASLAEDQKRSDSEWRERLDRNSTFGVFEAGSLVGIATYYIEAGTKTAHRGHLVGVYLRPAARGTGAVRLLFETLLAAARNDVRYLYLVVAASNARAIRFYERIGFTVYGRDPGGLMVDGVIYEDYLMMLRLDQGSGK